MRTARIAVTLDHDLLSQLDRWVKKHRFRSRSQGVQQAIRDKVNGRKHSRLARECAKVNPKAEQKLADEGLAQDFKEWIN